MNAKFNLPKIKKICKWTPEQRDIDWTDSYIKEQLKDREVVIWVTSSYSIGFFKNSKHAIITDINYGVEHSKWEAIEDLGRVLKVLDKLGYETVMPPDIVTINRGHGKRKIIGDIELNQPIPQATY